MYGTLLCDDNCVHDTIYIYTIHPIIHLLKKTFDYILNDHISWLHQQQQQSCKANTLLLTGVYTDVDDDNLSVLSSDDEDFSTEQEAAVHEDDVSLPVSLYILISNI